MNQKLKQPSFLQHARSRGRVLHATVAPLIARLHLQHVLFVAAAVGGFLGIFIVGLFAPAQTFAAAGPNNLSNAIGIQTAPQNTSVGVQTAPQPAPLDPDPVTSGCAQDRQLKGLTPFSVGRSSLPVLQDGQVTTIQIDPTTEMGRILHYYSPSCNKWWVSMQLDSPPVTPDWVLSTQLQEDQFAPMNGMQQGTFMHIHSLMTDSSQATGYVSIVFADGSGTTIPYGF